MQARIMPARQHDSLPMLPLCHSQSKASAPAELLSQCTTEWSRYFIASRIAPCSRYTAALAADLSPQQCLQPTSFSLPTHSAAKFRLDDSNSSLASSSSTSLSTSPTESTYSDGAFSSTVRAAASVLRKVASCAVTAKEKSRKRVQFADEVGQSLTRVKFLSDPLEAEAHWAAEVSAVSAGQQQYQQQYQQIPDQQAEPQLQLRCKFSQPISRYIVFREAVDRNLVSLSLVHLDFSTIRGAVAVKNVSFRKRVFARFTFDSWCSFRDVEATYNSSEGQQDNFTFSVQCPADQTADIQFCVCFECESGEFWDNNGTVNYRVAVSRSAADPNQCGYTKDFKPNFGAVSEFSEFTAWEHFPDRVYY